MIAQSTRLLARLPWQRLIKYVITGGMAIAIDFAIYYLLTRFLYLPYLASRTASFGVALVWNFTVNRNWTFQAKTGIVSRQATRFLIVMGVTLLLNLVLMRIGVSYLNINDLLVFIFVTGLTAVANFSAHMFWSYKV